MLPPGASPPCADTQPGRPPRSEQGTTGHNRSGQGRAGASRQGVKAGAGQAQRAALLPCQGRGSGDGRLPGTPAPQHRRSARLRWAHPFAGARGGEHAGCALEGAGAGDSKDEGDGFACGTGGTCTWTAQAAHAVQARRPRRPEARAARPVLPAGCLHTARQRRPASLAAVRAGLLPATPQRLPAATAATATSAPAAKASLRRSTTP